MQNGSPLADSLTDEGWKSADASTEDQQSSHGLEAIAAFNAGLGTTDGNTIDPQFSFSNAGMPDSQFDSAYNDVEQTFGPDPSTYNNVYTTEFGSSVTASSSYFQSVEQNGSPTYHPPPLRNNAFRRSISEPPNGLPVLSQHPGMHVMFHRENHYLGRPILQRPTPLKSLPRQKQPRSHPYSRKTRSTPEKYQQHVRPEPHRTYAQPAWNYEPLGLPMPQGSDPSHPLVQKPQYTSMRMCSPATEAFLMSPSQQIDPALSRLPTPAVMPPTPQMSSTPRNMVTIPLAVEELRSMVFEAVQQAIGGERMKDAENAAVQTSGAKQQAEEEPCAR